MLPDDPEFIAANLSGQVRRKTVGGREYLVAPLSLIVPGVLNGSRGPLLYPEAEVRRDTSIWNGMPLTKGHPTRNGSPVTTIPADPCVRTGDGRYVRLTVRYDGPGGDPRRTMPRSPWS